MTGVQTCALPICSIVFPSHDIRLQNKDDEQDDSRNVYYYEPRGRDREKEEKGVKISQANKVRTLLTKQKGLLKKKLSYTDFNEPVLFFTRRNGNTEIYENCTAGKFFFTHSNTKERYVEIRTADQQKMDYGDRKIRCYFGHEDFPFTGWSNPIVDSESIMMALKKVIASNLKYGIVTGKQIGRAHV